MAERIGSALARVLCLTYLAIFHRLRGQVEAALPYIARSL